MGRIRGIFNISSNYEPQISAPFDARQRVDYKSDLTNPLTWRDSDNKIYLYNGLLVSVVKDSATNNGVYILKDYINYQNPDSWEKLAKLSDIVSGEGIRGVKIDGEDLPVDGEGKVELPNASEESAGIIKIGREFVNGENGLELKRKEDSDIIDFDDNSISVESLVVPDQVNFIIDCNKEIPENGGVL